MNDESLLPGQSADERPDLREREGADEPAEPGPEETSELAPYREPVRAARGGTGARQSWGGLIAPVLLVLAVVMGGALGTLAGLRHVSAPAAGIRAGAIARPGQPTTPSNQSRELIVFSTTESAPSTTPDMLPAGVPAVYLFYDFPQIPASAVPRVRWWRDGRLIGEVPAAYIQPQAGMGAAGKAVLRAPKGSLGAGIYEVELTLGERRVTASFVVAWGAAQIASLPAPAESEVEISNAVIAAAVAADGSPRQPLTQVASGSQRIYFVFRYQKAEPGTALVVAWYGGQEAITSATREITLPAAAGWANAWLEAPATSPLPPGGYRAVVTMAGDEQALGSATFAIGPAAPVRAAPAPQTSGAGQPAR